MGNINEIDLLQKDLFNKVNKEYNRVLEIGSKDYGNNQQWRSIIKSKEWIGVDLEEGKNVDIVADLSKTISPLQEKSFDFILCTSVLEHVTKPWIFAKNVENLLTDNGEIYITVPYVWKFHGYPNDYYRYNHKGIQILFENIEFTDQYFSTYGGYKNYRITDDKNFERDMRFLTKKVNSNLFPRFYNNRPKPDQGIDFQSPDCEKVMSYIQILMLGKNKG